MLVVEEIKIPETITVPRYEYEQLVRESANLSSIESLARSGAYVCSNIILAICGYVKEVDEND